MSVCVRACERARVCVVCMCTVCMCVRACASVLEYARVCLCVRCVYARLCVRECARVYVSVDPCTFAVKVSVLKL